MDGLGIRRGQVLLTLLKNRSVEVALIEKNKLVSKLFYFWKVNTISIVLQKKFCEIMNYGQKFLWHYANAEFPCLFYLTSLIFD